MSDKIMECHAQDARHKNSVVQFRDVIESTTELDFAERISTDGNETEIRERQIFSRHEGEMDSLLEHHAALRDVIASHTQEASAMRITCGYRRKGKLALRQCEAKEAKEKADDGSRMVMSFSVSTAGESQNTGSAWRRNLAGSFSGTNLFTTRMGFGMTTEFQILSYGLHSSHQGKESQTFLNGQRKSSADTDSVSGLSGGNTGWTAK